jgi:outer membrane protein TolC
MRELNLLTQLRSYEVDKINNEIRNAYRSLDSAKISLEILDQNLMTAQDSLARAQRMVAEGLSSNREVLDAQDSLSSVENGILNARVNYYLAALNIKNAIGEDLLETVFK